MTTIMPVETSLRTSVNKHPDPSQRLQHAYAPQIWARMRLLVPRGNPCSPTIGRALGHALLERQGKCLRGTIVMTVLHALVPQAPRSLVDGALTMACALETVHGGSLSQDDIIDNDDVRSGQPACHAAYTKHLAMLVGTVAFPLACEMVTGCDSSLTAHQRVQFMSDLSYAVNIEGGLVGGVAAELEWNEKDPGAARKLDFIHEAKTAILFWLAARAGGVAANVDDGKLTQLGTYGRNLGLAFQIIDDVGDMGRDSGNGSPNYANLHGLEKARTRARSLLEEARAIVRGLGVDGVELEAVVEFVSSLLT